MIWCGEVLHLRHRKKGDQQMRRKFLQAATVVLAAMLMQSLAASADDQRPDDQKAWQRELLAWRTKRAANLQAPEGWLSLIALGWLKEGDNTFGSAEDCRVQIAGKWPGHIATVRLEKGALRLLPPAGGFPKDLLVDGQPAKEQALVSDDVDKPTKLTIGTLTILATTTHLHAPGVAEFTLDGQVVRLEPVLEDPKSTDLFFILRDATGKTT